jgi:glycine/D-amino acid oxidase-like deaminating enzyme
MTPDHRPLIGHALATIGLYLHTGYSGHGIMGAPAGARILADCMASPDASSANTFDPRRFAENAPSPDIERVVI